MNRDRKGVNGNKHKRDHHDKPKKGIHNGKTKESIDITLPYSFIPFAKQFYFPYTYECLPKHNELKGFSGSISYTITPKADLYTETRVNKDGQHFLSGSSVRGLVRSNVEILSASYPEFIDRTQMLYRKLAGGKRYLQILTNNDDSTEQNKKQKRPKDTEKEIQVGYLQKQGNEYYVVPAKKFRNGKNFTSIKEHTLYQMNLKRNYSLLYKIEFLNEINEIQEKIDKLTFDIKKYRQCLDQEVKQKIEDLFLYQFSFYDLRKALKKIKHRDKVKEIENKINEIEKFKIKLYDSLKSLLNSVDLGIDDKDDFCSKYAERWKLKAEIDLKYTQQRNNRSFKPYQIPILLKTTANGNIMKLSSDYNNDEILLKGCLFNSTNASSKRSHYVIREPDLTVEPIHVPQSVINAYENMRKKMRINADNPSIKKEIELFYNLFNDSPRWKQKEINNYSDQPVIFYRIKEVENSEKVKVDIIGRTPYFKVPYDYQIDELIGEKDKGRIDYATALFGYVNEEINDEGNANKNEENDRLQSFKSRVRFGPIDIIGSPIFKEPAPLLLPSPSASAEAMYLKQDQPKLVTYEKTVTKGYQKKPELNGYKYYHVLKNKVDYTPKKDTENIESKRKVLEPQGIQLKGKIHFTNLTKEEIGLLLLGVDVSLFHKSDLFKQVFADEDLNECYDLLGGGKPYGYGKVKIKVDSLNLETRGNDFHSLMLSKEEKKEGTQLKEYINSFISEMNGTEYFENVHLVHYLQSKKVFQEVKGVKHYNWSNMKKKQVGYDKNERLISPARHLNKD
ncbi:hypothetical protein [Shouchella clausii]|uniref:hypothetical protein n=1 Tax=Shouchella clausii TaxID=79880 RepID=UPI000BA748DB|nr:hypothetical protein [Shouchella clausii]PAD17102.1 hypothetical protein CHH73_10365 [Shouchella clausii]